MNLQQARAEWLADKPFLASRGIHLDGVVTYATDDLKHDYSIAMDAQPALQTVASGGIPAILTTTIDPEVIRVRFTPNKAAEIFGEVQKGDWLTDTIAFPVSEAAGEVSSYGDYSNNGTTDANLNWPQRQNYLYQTIEEYGEREVARAGLAGINLVSEKDMAAATVIGRFENYAYFFGIAGLQNYGLLNDPALPPALTASTKAANGGTGWFTAGGAPNATSNEVYNDVLANYTQLVVQTGGLISEDDEIVLVLSPANAVALEFMNTFGIKAKTALKEAFPKLRIVTAVQYGKQTPQNPQGIVAGNFMQMIAVTVDGQKTGYCAYSDKMRTHPLVQELSSQKKKVSGGVWGAVIRIPYAIASMVGI